MKNLIHRLLVFLHLKKAGYFRMEFRGIPIILRDDIPDGTMYLINNDLPPIKFDVRPPKVKVYER